MFHMPLVEPDENSNGTPFSNKQTSLVPDDIKKPYGPLHCTCAVIDVSPSLMLSRFKRYDLTGLFPAESIICCFVEPSRNFAFILVKSGFHEHCLVEGCVYPGGISDFNAN